MIELVRRMLAVFELEQVTSASGRLMLSPPEVVY